MDDNRVNISVSIGIVKKTVFYQSPDEVLRDVEMALARCKELGPGLVKVFDKKCWNKRLSHCS